MSVGCITKSVYKNMLLTFLFFSIFTGNVYGGSSCKTPNNQDGECVSIFLCDPLVTKLRGNLTENVITFLRNSTCGFIDKTPQVCCPTESLSKSLSKEASSCSMTVAPPAPGSKCCGYQDVGVRVYGGDVTNIDIHPWLALIEFNKDKEVILNKCGGVLISSKYVLTAAHCVTRDSVFGKPSSIRLGEYDISHDGKDCVKINAADDCTDGHISIPIEKIIVHHDYNGKSTLNDIALIRLEKNAPYTDFIRPICLPKLNAEVIQPVARLLSIAGWSSRDDGTPKTSKRLYNNIPLIKLEQCQAALNNTKLAKGQLCAGDMKENTCSSDYGGPLTWHNREVHEVIGILSFGPRTCRSEKPTVFTNVFEYKDWIVSHTKE